MFGLLASVLKQDSGVPLSRRDKKSTCFSKRVTTHPSISSCGAFTLAYKRPCNKPPWTPNISNLTQRFLSCIPFESTLKKLKNCQPGGMNQDKSGLADRMRSPVCILFHLWFFSEFISISVELQFDDGFFLCYQVWRRFRFSFVGDAIKDLIDLNYREICLDL